MWPGGRICIGALCLAMASACVATSPVPPHIAAAVASPLRRPQDLARDPTQRPAEVLAFSGVKPGDRVADFWPLPPYSTGLLSAAVGPQGKVYGIFPTKVFNEIPEADGDLKRALGPFPNVTLLVQPFDKFQTPEQLDLVWLGKIYHDFTNPVESGDLDIAAVNRAIFQALKPGGVLIVIDHAAERGSKFQDVEPDQPKRVHRIDPDLVKSQILAAGFEFAGESRVLANPADDHTKSVFDPAIRDHTDRFIFKFRKPPTKP
jgi:predicted methyltransferase